MISATRWRSIHRAVAATFAIGALLGCGVRASAAPSARHADGGIRGRVVLGPTCPVQRPGQSCVRPYRATIVIRSAATGRRVARVRATAAGRFAVPLRAGRYLLVPETGLPFPRASEQAVRVLPGRYTAVVVRYDTGIR